MSEHELWNELGNLYFMSGSYNQAVNAYRRSIGLDANFGRPYSNLALTYVQQGRYDEAIELYRTSIELLAENKERAISWNRLGAVYRHLKDYSKAVIAFQEADELDPQSVDEFPAGTNAQADAAQLPSSVLDEFVDSQEDAASEVPWWDIDEDEAMAARLAQAAPAAIEDRIESWSPTDLGQYQQDVSQLPATGSLTTWGDADLEDDFEVFSPFDPEPDFHIPGPDDDDLSTWLPVPEEEPVSMAELDLPVVLEEEPVSMAELDLPVVPEVAEVEAEPIPEWHSAPSYHVIQSIDFAPLLPATAITSGMLEYAERIETGSNRQTGAQQAWDTQEVDLDVEDRPNPDFSVVEQEHVKAITPEPMLNDITLEPATTPILASEPVQVTANEPVLNDIPLEPATAPILASGPESVTAPVLATKPDRAAAPVLERDADELHEIETGIAKFKRVVQLNPRNAHAWDALGTLYKSAGMYKDAILAYQEAISNDASRSLYYHHLGLVYACEGRDEDAISAFQRVIEIDPEYSLAHATLGGYYRKMGLEELAQQHIGKAMKNIFDSENEYNRACLEAICGNADQAIKLLGVALKNKQTYVDWILRDPDLDFIRQDPRFKQLISDFSR